MDETRVKLSLSGDFWLAMFSIFSILFFWIPIILVLSQLKDDDRRLGLIFTYSFPIQIVLFALSLKVLCGYMRFLREKQIKRFYSSVILRILISLPTLAGGISVIVCFLIWIGVSVYYFWTKI